MLGMPSFGSHKTLMAHDALHGQGHARFGARAHWLRTWLVQRTRQWSTFDMVVCGANPILGALACRAIAKAGKTALWCWPESFDAWDYPLSGGGAHDDLLVAAGLPPMGPRLFEEIGAQCSQKIVIARGWTVDYAFPEGHSRSLNFISRAPSQASRFGPARQSMERWASAGFSGCAALATLKAPARHGGGARQQIVEAAFSVWVSDQLDGKERVAADASRAALGADESGSLRLGRARWHAQSPLAFADESRQDIKRALAWGAAS